MVDLTSTRLNHLVDPTLHVWAWQIPVYLFLGGLVAGLMVLLGVMLLPGVPRREHTLVRTLPLLALGLLSAGMLALFLDLEHKLHVLRLYTTFQVRSPMSWGAWILVAVYPALAVAALLDPPAVLRRVLPGIERLTRRLSGSPGAPRWIGGLLIGLGISLGTYTGILLNTLAARPAWNSALLGPLFLVSGLSSGAALGSLLARDHDEGELFERADLGFLNAKLALLVLFCVSLATSTRAHQEAAALFLGGPYTAVFWVGVVGLGAIVPVALHLFAMFHRAPHTRASAWLALAGGMLLRIVIVSAGQHSGWRGP